MFLLINDDVIVGISEQDTGISVPESVGYEIEALLLRQDIIVKYINGDVRVVNNPRYWTLLFEDALNKMTAPTEMTINYGETIRFRIADQLPIIVAYASCDVASNRSFCDLDNTLHLLTPYEWKNVLNQICDVLSQLAQIRNLSSGITADSEERYKTLCDRIKHKVDTAYGRP